MIYEINLWDCGYDDYPTLQNSVFGEFKLVKNADIGLHKHSEYGTGFDRRGTFSVGNEFDKNVIIFEEDVGSSVHVDNKKKDILIFGHDSTQGLDNTTLTAEKKYSINFTELNKKTCLRLHYNGANTCLFVNAVEIFKFNLHHHFVNLN